MILTAVNCGLMKVPSCSFGLGHGPCVRVNHRRTAGSRAFFTGVRACFILGGWGGVGWDVNVHVS